MKYFLIAGEASGDLHGANLMVALKKLDPEAEFAYWGGDRMESVAEGLQKHYREIALMGFVEVLLNLRKIYANLNLCKNQIKAFNPDVVILIDFPGFNLRIAEYCKLAGYKKVVYYIAPKVWAWKENRVKKLENYVDLLLLIFPFEINYFKQWKVNAVYCGNPLQDEISALPPALDFKQKHNLDNRPLITLMPGSRKQEIKRMLPEMLKITRHFPAYQFLIAGAPGINPAFYAPYLRHQERIVYNETYALLKNSDAAIVCSGTATLETALLNVPQVCGYAGNRVSFEIARRLVKIRFISLVNLCLGRESIRELIQQDYTSANLESELQAILPGGHKHEKMLADYAELNLLLGGAGASMKAAETIAMLP